MNKKDINIGSKVKVISKTDSLAQATWEVTHINKEAYHLRNVETELLFWCFKEEMIKLSPKDYLLSSTLNKY